MLFVIAIYRSAERVNSAPKTYVLEGLSGQPDIIPPVRSQEEVLSFWVPGIIVSSNKAFASVASTRRCGRHPGLSHPSGSDLPKLASVQQVGWCQNRTGVPGVSAEMGVQPEEQLHVSCWKRMLGLSHPVALPAPTMVLGTVVVGGLLAALTLGSEPEWSR